MFAFLRRLFGGNRSDAPPPEDAHQSGSESPFDPELQQILDGIDQKWTDELQRERAAEALLTPRERIKKRLNLPAELPANYQADPFIIVQTQTSSIPAVPMILVVNNNRVGITMPQVLFEYLYRQHPPALYDQRVINDYLRQWGLNPESL